MLPAALALLLSLPGSSAPLAPAPAGGAEHVARTYRVRQTCRLSQIPEGSQRVQWWVAVPGDERHQDVLDMRVVSAPGPWRLVREGDQGNLFLYVEAEKPAAAELETVVEFTLRREPVRVDVDPEKVGALTDEHRALLAAECRTDAPHMEVTPEIRELAERACGEEANPARQMRALLAAVAERADHYSKDPSKPKCGIGDAGDCLLNGGGCCTDLHSLYIAMARARGIPSRLQMGYRLLEKNAGKEVDPGYRCWVESFLPGYGWVPADIVEADAADGEGPDLWFNGLSERRLWLNQGRDFALEGARSGRVNHMSHAYAEIDGRPARLLPEGDLAPQITRVVHFEELAASGAAPLSAP